MFHDICLVIDDDKLVCNVKLEHGINARGKRQRYPCDYVLSIQFV